MTTLATCLFLGTVLALSGCTTPSAHIAMPASATMPVLWIAPTNTGVFAGMNPAFSSLFTQDSQWAEARSGTHVFKFYNDSLKKHIPDAFLQHHIIPKLKEWDMQVAFEMVSGTATHCAQRIAAVYDDIAFLDKFKSFGGSIDYLVMDSPLSYHHPEIDCPLDFARAAHNVLNFTTIMKQRYPGVKIGLTYPLPLHFHGDLRPGMKVALTRLTNFMAAHGQRLDFVVGDNPYEYAMSIKRVGYGSFAQIKDIEDFVKYRLGLPFGLIINSEEGGRTSNALFYTRTLDMYKRYVAAGGQADFYLIQSWFPHPDVELPENSNSDHPFTKLIRDFIRLRAQ